MAQEHHSSSDASHALLTLHGGYDPGKAYNWSPFVTKLEARLRFSRRPYRRGAGSPSKAPKGKVPYIQLHGRRTGSGASADEDVVLTMGDSTLITKKLIALGDLDDLNAALSPAQKAQDLMLRALVEEKLYFYWVHEGWTQEQNFYRNRDEGPLSTIPYPVRVLLGSFVQRSIVRALNSQGTGRHSVDEIDQLVDEGVAALNDFYTAHASSAAHQGHANPASKNPPWIFGGEKPTEADASLYGFLVAALVPTANPKLGRTVRKYPALMSYAEKVHSAYFSEYKKWQD